jgi:uncharacterized protein YkwD
MKNRFRSIAAALLTLALLLSCAVPSALAGDEVSVEVSAKFLYDEARSMLGLVNDFRTGDEAYYLDKDNQTRVSAAGLKELSYDYNLEKTAMLRALELAVYFSHTRPNGKQWSTAHSGRYTMGENIAYGYGSAKAVFDAFREDNEGYSGQGHRRNMLQGSFTRAGFGCVKVGGTVYWAQEFGSGSAGGSSSDRFSADSVNATWSTLRAGKTKIQADTKELVVPMGGSVKLPKAILTSGSGAKNSVSKLKWESSKKKIAKVKGGKLVAVKEGKTTLTADLGGTTLKVKVRVVPEGKTEAMLVPIDDYDTPLGLEETEIFFLDTEGECFLNENDIPETAE